MVAPFGDGPPHAAAVITALDVTYEVLAAESLARAEMLARCRPDEFGGRPGQRAQELTEALVPPVCDVAAVFVTHADPSDRVPRPSSCR